jgi:hypothetical protein
MPIRVRPIFHQALGFQVQGGVQGRVRGPLREAEGREEGPQEVGRSDVPATTARISDPLIRAVLLLELGAICGPRNQVR